MDKFFREVDFMCKLDHPHIVKLLGVVSLSEPYSMLFEYMDLGDLCSFLCNAAMLSQEGEESVISTADKLSVCLQVNTI